MTKGCYTFRKKKSVWENALVLAVLCGMLVCGYYACGIVWYVYLFFNRLHDYDHYPTNSCDTTPARKVEIAISPPF